MENGWSIEEETFLRQIQRNCEDLSVQYRRIYESKRKQQAKFRIPSIVLGGITSITSFGSYGFPPSSYRAISMTVGGVSLFIAILNTIESYMKVGEIMGNSLQSSVNFQKLADEISCELSIPPAMRPVQGIIYMKDSFNTYHKYLDTAPPMLKIPFIPLPPSSAPLRQDVEDPYSRGKKPRLSMFHKHTPSQKSSPLPTDTLRAVHFQDTFTPEQIQSGSTFYASSNPAASRESLDYDTRSQSHSHKSLIIPPSPPIPGSPRVIFTITEEQPDKPDDKSGDKNKPINNNCIIM